MPGVLQPPVQLTLPFDVGLRSPRQSKTKPKKRTPKQADERQPLIHDRYFLPVVGVPKTRGDCPKERPCPHVRCRWHLHLSDAEHRAGRPGLGNVPRDERGWTVPMEGWAGEERAGTTAEPRWLELERRCAVYVERDHEGRFLSLNAFYEAEWDQFAERLHADESIDVLEGSWCKGETIAMSERRARLMGARMTHVGALALEREPRGGEFAFTLMRRRGVNSCALDLIDQHGKCSNETIGDGIGRHRTLVAREVKRGLHKAIAEAEKRGLERGDLMGALENMGETK